MMRRLIRPAARRLFGSMASGCPYAILGVNRGSSDAEIKAAWRREVLGCHPDTSPDNPSAAAKFARVQQAYASLTEATSNHRWLEQQFRSRAEENERQRRATAEYAQRMKAQAEEAYRSTLRGPIFIDTPINLTGPIDGPITGKDRASWDTLVLHATHLMERRRKRLDEQPAQRTLFSLLLLFGSNRPRTVYPYLQRFSALHGATAAVCSRPPDDLQDLLSAKLWACAGLSLAEQGEQATVLRSYRQSARPRASG